MTDLCGRKFHFLNFFFQIEKNEDHIYFNYFKYNLDNGYNKVSIYGIVVQSNAPRYHQGNQGCLYLPLCIYLCP